MDLAFWENTEKISQIQGSYRRNFNSTVENAKSIGEVRQGVFSYGTSESPWEEIQILDCGMEQLRVGLANKIITLDPHLVSSFSSNGLEKK